MSKPDEAKPDQKTADAKPEPSPAAAETLQALSSVPAKDLTTAEKRALKETESVALAARTHVGGVRIAPDAAA